MVFFKRTYREEVVNLRREVDDVVDRLRAAEGRIKCAERELSELKAKLTGHRVSQLEREMTVVRNTLRDFADVLEQHDMRKPATDGATLPLFSPSPSKE